MRGNTTLGTCLMTSKIDDEVGRLIGALEETGEIDRSGIAFMTEHSPQMLRAKSSRHEWGRHSTLIVRGPGVSGAGRGGHGSCLDSGHRSNPAEPCREHGAEYMLEGRFRSAFGWPADARSYVFLEHHDRNRLNAIRGERFKLIRSHTARSR